MSFFGLFGDEDSSSTTATTNDTTNSATSIDKRSVASESAVSLTGDANSIDRSSTTSFFDTSNRSSNDLTSFIDNSNRSTTFTDKSDRSVHTTTTDYGSVNASLKLAGSMTDRAFGVAGSAIDGAIDVLKLQTVEGQKTIMGAFDMARASGANSMASSAAVLGFASKALEQTNEAFQNAEDSGQSKMVMGALAVVCIIGVAFALKN
jgi:hypothetical protein